MNALENKERIRRMVDEVNRRGIVAFHEATAIGYQNHGTGSFPDLSDAQRTVQDLVAEGDRVVLRFTGRATHTPSGREVTWETIHIYRMADGKIAEHWGIMDRYSILHQLEAASEAAESRQPNA